MKIWKAIERVELRDWVLETNDAACERIERETAPSKRYIRKMRYRIDSMHTLPHTRLNSLKLKNFVTQAFFL